MRKLVALVIWYAVFTLVLLAPLLVIAAHACAQDVVVSAPEDMRNPATGEEGTWIPRWAERAHVLDAHQLELCLKDVELADGQLDALEDRHTALAAALSDIEHARDEAEVATFAAEQLTKSHETQLERRLRAVWGLVGASVALGVATTILILR